MISKKKYVGDHPVVAAIAGAIRTLERQCMAIGLAVLCQGVQPSPAWPHKRWLFGFRLWFSVGRKKQEVGEQFLT